MPDVFSAFNALAVSTDSILGDALAPYALFSTQKRVIGTIAIDVPIQEVHDDSYTATQHPVSSGTPVSDHIFANPAKLQMTCGFSDSTAGYQGYSQQVYAALKALGDSRMPFSVSTSKRYYENMSIEDLSTTTDPQSEYALFVTVRLQEIIISETSTSGGTMDGVSSDQSNHADPATTSPTQDAGTKSLQSTGTESETAASAKAATIAGYQTPVTTPQPAVGGPGGISPGPRSSGGIGSA